MGVDVCGCVWMGVGMCGWASTCVDGRRRVWMGVDGHEYSWMGLDDENGEWGLLMWQLLTGGWAPVWLATAFVIGHKKLTWGVRYVADMAVDDGWRLWRSCG